MRGKWGGARANSGPSPKLTEEQREAVAYDYVARQNVSDSDFIQRPRPYRDRIIGELASDYGVGKRTIVRCLVEFKIRRIRAKNRAENKRILKDPRFKKNLEYLKSKKT